MRREAEEALRALADRHGGALTPEMVVAEATDPASPLHENFEWDNAAAGAAYRLHQARQLIRSVRVEVRSETRAVSVPYFIRDPEVPHAEQGYRSLPRLASDEDAARAAVIRDVSRAVTLLRNAQNLAVALNLGGAIADMAERVEALLAQASGTAPDAEGAES